MRETVSGEREAVNGEREAVNGEREAVNGEREAVNGEREAVNGEREAGSGKRKTAHRSPLTAHRLPLTAYRLPLTAHRSSLTAHRLPLIAHRSPLIAHRSPLIAGFVLPAAIFLLVVLGGLAAWLLQLTTATQAQDALAIEGERAYRAAEAGLEAGIYAARVNSSCAAQTLTFTGALSRFTASVACAASTANEAGTDITFYKITSIACNQPNAGACPNAASTLPEYAERQMQAVVEAP